MGDGKGKRDLLFHEWAALKKILKFQPLDDVRDYFGVKVALYFAWLGFYTNLLIVPSCVGVICFIYGLLSLSSHIPSQEICKNETTTMCPACDQGIQGRVSMVVTIHNNLLTQGRHIPIGLFITSIFLIQKFSKISILKVNYFC